MSGGQPAERRLVWVQAGGKLRPGIALRVWEDGTVLVAFVAFGTGTHRPELTPEIVPLHSAEAKALDLTKTTYFYANNVCRQRVEDIQWTDRLCPPGLFLRLRRKVGF